MDSERSTRALLQQKYGSFIFLNNLGLTLTHLQMKLYSDIIKFI